MPNGAWRSCRIARARESVSPLRATGLPVSTSPSPNDRAGREGGSNGPQQACRSPSTVSWQSRSPAGGGKEICGREAGAGGTIARVSRSRSPCLTPARCPASGAWREAGRRKPTDSAAGARPDRPFERNALMVVWRSRTGSTAIFGTSSRRGSIRGTARVELRLSEPCSIADGRAIGCRLPPMRPWACR